MINYKLSQKLKLIKNYKFNYKLYLNASNIGPLTICQKMMNGKI